MSQYKDPPQQKNIEKETKHSQIARITVNKTYTSTAVITWLSDGPHQDAATGQPPATQCVHQRVILSIIHETFSVPFRSISSHETCSKAYGGLRVDGTDPKFGGLYGPHQTSWVASAIEPLKRGSNPTSSQCPPLQVLVVSGSPSCRGCRASAAPGRCPESSVRWGPSPGDRSAVREARRGRSAEEVWVKTMC